MTRSALLAVILLGGCASLEARGSARSGLYLGAVSVHVPQTQGEVAAVAVKTFGAGWDRGPFIGWRSENRITADPAKCQLLIVIRADVEAANAVSILNALEGQDPCIVDYTNSLRR